MWPFRARDGRGAAGRSRPSRRATRSSTPSSPAWTSGATPSSRSAGSGSPRGGSTSPPATTKWRGRPRRSRRRASCCTASPPRRRAAARRSPSCSQGFIAFCAGDILVGHFVEIDLQFLAKELARAGLPPLANRAIDTWALYDWLAGRAPHDGGPGLPRLRDPRLPELAEALGVPRGREHHALADAFVTAQVFQRLLRRLPRWGVATLGHLLRIGDPRRAAEGQSLAAGMTRRPAAAGGTIIAARHARAAAKPPSPRSSPGRRASCAAPSASSSPSASPSARVILALGWLSYRSVKEVVTEDFNQQQLVLAKYAARQISHLLAMLRKELRLLGRAPALQYQERLALAGRLESAFMSVKDDGAVQIRFVTAPGTAVHVYDAPGYRRAEPGTPTTRCTCSGPRTPPTAQAGPRHARRARRRAAGTLLMRMVHPVWQDAVDEAHPTPTRRFAGRAGLRRRRRRADRRRDPRHPLRQDRLRLGHRRRRHLPAPPGGGVHRQERLRGARRRRCRRSRSRASTRSRRP